MKLSELIDKQVADLTDWRGKMLANLRKVIHDADPEIIEEWKWMGTPVLVSRWTNLRGQRSQG